MKEANEGKDGKKEGERGERTKEQNKSIRGERTEAHRNSKKVMTKLQPKTKTGEQQPKAENRRKRYIPDIGAESGSRSTTVAESKQQKCHASLQKTHRCYYLSSGVHADSKRPRTASEQTQRTGVSYPTQQEEPARILLRSSQARAKRSGHVLDVATGEVRGRASIALLHVDLVTSPNASVMSAILVRKF